MQPLNCRPRRLSLALQNDGQRLLWQPSPEQAAAASPEQAARSVDLQSSCSDFFIDELDIRSFAIQLQQQ
jgi:hypothetical protein